MSFHFIFVTNFIRDKNQLYGTHIDYVNCIWNFKQIHVMVVCLIPLGLPILHHSPSNAQKVKSKLSPIKNPRDMHVNNSLPNVATHMLYVNIYHAGCYQLEIVLAYVLISITMGM